MGLQRRTFLSVAGASVAATAGCLGILSGTTTFEAEKAFTDESVASSESYQQQEPTKQSAERTFSAAGQEKTVQVVNWVTEYYKTVDIPVLEDQRAAVFATVSTPQVNVLGKSFNPVGDATEVDIARRFQSQYSGFAVGDRVSRQDVSTLGTTASTSRFEGTATLNGRQVDVYVFVTESIEHADDHVVALGVYPQEIDEEAAMLSMIENLVHPA
ncbi:DUF6517 family protein [Haloarchaeobius sp. HRN-SO-5]|uniref:DUF6517 family protein n=1 Tax=Haloarchaeobius sp. HRN-SO-5 TaxID=3446118 RepID=UPI003EBEFA38